MHRIIGSPLRPAKPGRGPRGPYRRAQRRIRGTPDVLDRPFRRARQPHAELC